MKRALRDQAKRRFVRVTICRNGFAVVARAEMRRKTTPTSLRAERLDLCGNGIGFDFVSTGPQRRIPS